MNLKAVLESLDEVPEALQELYEEIDGRFVLNLEGVEEHPSTRPLKNALDREKESRRKANEKAEELNAEFVKFKDLDPDAARDAIDKLQKMDDKKDIDEGEIEKVVARQTERMRADYEARIAAMTKTNEELTTTLAQRDRSLADIKIFSEVKDAALANGARKTALDDIVNRAQNIFKLKDGEVTPFRPDSDEIYYGKSGEPMSIGEFIEGLSKTAEHLFEPNSGGGANGSNESRRGSDKGFVIDATSHNAIGENLAAIAEGKATFARTE